MSDMEAKIRITAENNASAGLNNVAADVDSAAARIKNSGSEMGQAMNKAISDLKQKMAEVNTSIGNGFDKMADKMDEGARKAEASIDKIGNSMGKLQSVMMGFFTVNFAQGLLHTADSMSVLDNQVRQVTASESEYVRVKEELIAVSNRTRADLEATGTLYVRASRALQGYGHSQQEVLKFTEATNNAMAIGGVAAEQQASALLQLSQALGSGVLQGDEFKSISEAAPILLDTIAEYMDKSRGEIKKLGSEGKLTAEVIFEAISGASEKFAEQAAKMPLNFGQSLTILNNNWSVFVNELMNSTGIMSGVASVVKLVADNLNYIVPVVAGLAAAVLATVAPTLAATAAAWGLNAALLANPIGLVVAGIGIAIALFNEFADEIGVLGDGFTTLRDVVTATFEIIGETIGSAVDTAKALFSGLTDYLDITIGSWQELFTAVMDAIDGIVSPVINAIAGYWLTAWQMVAAAWGDAPGFFSNLGNAIANVFLAAIEWMVNKAIDKINGLIEYANKAASMVGMSGINKIANVSVSRRDDGGLGAQVAGNFSRDYTAEFAAAVRNRAQRKASDREIEKAAGTANGATPATRTSSAGSAGTGGGKKAKKSGGGSGRDTRVSDWSAEIAAQKLAFQEMQFAQGTHEKWSLETELNFWQDKLKLVDTNSKAGLEIRRKIYDLQNKLFDENAKTEEQRIVAEQNAAKARLAMAEEEADHLLATGRITQAQRLDLALGFEAERYEIASTALQERLKLAESDPDRNPELVAKIHEQLLELERNYQLQRTKIGNKKEQQNQKDNPSFSSMLEEGGGNVWQNAQQQMSTAFTAMLTRTQSFSRSMTNAYKSMGQSFIQEMVTKPLMGMMQRMVQESAIYKAIFGTKEALETASKGKTIANKTEETISVVGSNATQAGSGAAAAMASIPYVGPILAVAAMGAMIASVMSLIGGGGGESTSTTTTRIPSAAGGWDIPSGINPLTQLHENEMVLPAEHANTIREMAGSSGSGGGETVIINTTGGDFIHKRDLAKLLKTMRRDFKFA